MKTEEISPTDWPAFCRRFSDANAGSLLTVERIDPGGRREGPARDLPLHRIEFGKWNECSDQIQVILGTPTAAETAHRVIEPIHVILRESSAGRKILQIIGENGTLEVTFHSGKFPGPDNRPDHEPGAKSS